MYDQEFYSDLEKFNREYYKNKLIFESVHPIDIINENVEVLSEAAKSKIEISKLLADILYKMTVGLTKFAKMTDELIKRNTTIVNDFNKVNLDLIDFNDFEYEIHDIKTAMSNIRKRMNIVKYDERDSELLLTNNGLQYKSEKFPETFNEDGQINKALFNGTVNSENGMMKITGNSHKDMFKACLDVLNSRKDISGRLAASNNYRQGLLKSLTQGTIQQTNNESVMYDVSIFKDEYIDILLEDAVTTPNDIKKEENNNEKGISNDPEQSQENINNNRQIDAIIKYNEICNSVDTTIMTSLDSLYGEAIKYCSRVTQLSNKNNK